MLSVCLTAGPRLKDRLCIFCFVTVAAVTTRQNNQSGRRSWPNCKADDKICICVPGPVSSQGDISDPVGKCWIWARRYPPMNRGGGFVRVPHLGGCLKNHYTVEFVVGLRYKRAKTKELTPYFVSSPCRRLRRNKIISRALRLASFVRQTSLY